MKVLVTGSCGLIGSEAVRYYNERAKMVVGIDNNMRAELFGADGDTQWMRQKLESECSKYRHCSVDIRDRNTLEEIVEQLQPDLIIHCAAQPSHDLAARMPHTDFEINAVGSLNLLEAARLWVPETVFVFLSSNKVYGDAPNNIEMKELETRWDYADPKYSKGIPETFTIDQSKHSLFGASKVAADIMVQEYGRYFGMKSAVFRGGCLTGPAHSSAELHGFLSYFFKAASEGRTYTIYGYKGKQVRDNIHSADVISAINKFYRNPKSGAVYNIGGGKEGSVSILECIDRVENLLKKKINFHYTNQNRNGDHICYYSDCTKFRTDFPDWRIKHSIDDIFEELAKVYFSNRYS
jgi:CDP-paratose 2-epimerase